ncbi:MAG: type 4a pilus biogenesis protein PilO [Candidatus Omnitrophica bacterium]|nr:type 4a pilus biogenesis protein PilO [Candidatus Omnitrophota bacterium]
MIDFTTIDKKKLMLIGLAGLIALYLDFSFVVMAQLKGLSESESKITKLKYDIDKLNRDLASMQSQKQGNINSSSKRQLVIKEEDVTLFLEKVQDLANKSGVVILQLKQAGTVAEGVLAKSPIQALKVSADLLCTYHTLGAFINSLENSDIFVNVEDLKITLSPADIFRQNANLSMTIYVKK